MIGTATAIIGDDGKTSTRSGRCFGVDAVVAGVAVAEVAAVAGVARVASVSHLR